MLRESMKAQLKEDEGTGPTKDGRMLPYFDCCGKFFRECECVKQGHLTIGWGRNIEDIGISYAEGDGLLEHDIDAASALVGQQYQWTAGLDGVRYAVLTNMMFNMGARTLGGFTTTLRLVQQGLYADAAKQMLKSKWASQVGKRAVRLAKQMDSGEI